MSRTEIINKLLFEYDALTERDIALSCAELPKKLLRWLGSVHPDNKTRKIFFELTNIRIGDNTVINQHFIVSDGFKPLLRIGSRVAISPNVTIICESDPNNSELAKMAYVKNKLICKKGVLIEDDAWIGANVVILPGLTIRRSAIVGAGSIVTKDVEPLSIVAGVPARKIGEIG